MSKKQILLQVFVVLCVFGLGAALGFWGKPPSSDESDVVEDQPSHASHSHIHITLSRQAYKNIGLKVGVVEPSDAERTRTIPGQVIEMPGRSDHALAAPVTGVVSKVFAAPGQAVRLGDPLFELQVTDESLISAQVALLDVLARIGVVEDEIKRLAKLTESGVVTGEKKRELEYERKQLETQRKTKLQELAVRGLSDEQVETITDEKQLVRKLTVYLPESLGRIGKKAEPPPEEKPSSELGKKDTWDYTLEELKVYPGASVQRGDDLCHLAYHSQLYIQGQAFENDLQAIEQLDQKHWSLTAEFGHQQHHNHSHHTERSRRPAGDVVSKQLVRRDLKILYLDNHVDPTTQTFLFYIPLENEVAQDRRDEHGQLYRTWQFKPGQRVHLRVPVEKWEKKFKVPLDAIALEGSEVYVFEQHRQNETMVEFVPISVQLLHRDDQYAILESDGQLEPKSKIALNGAYQIYLTMKIQTDGGGHGHQH